VLHGWIILDKPVGIGSTQCVSAVKGALRDASEPKTKVGHGGTLDPLASGVLPVALGEATKLAGRMLDATKEYEFTIRFGEETDTLDAEGAIVTVSHHYPSLADVEVVLPRFTGLIEQVPPAYSAIKIAGKAAYARARAGEALEMKPRRVTVHSLSVRPDPVERLPIPESKPPGRASTSQLRRVERITLAAVVSKGTYIRSLARDIAHALGSVGHVTMLRRTRAGPFGLETAISLDKLAEIAKARTLDGAVLPLQAGLDDIPALPVTPEQALLLHQGQRLVGNPAKPGTHLAMDGERPVALVEVSADDIRVVRGFNL
jgi:tRNA pseudouridine55 synthase